MIKILSPQFLRSLFVLSAFLLGCAFSKQARADFQDFESHQSQLAFAELDMALAYLAQKNIPDGKLSSQMSAHYLGNALTELSQTEELSAEVKIRQVHKLLKTYSEIAQALPYQMQKDQLYHLAQAVRNLKLPQRLEQDESLLSFVEEVRARFLTPILQKTGISRTPQTERLGVLQAHLTKISEAMSSKRYREWIDCADALGGSRGTSRPEVEFNLAFDRLRQLSNRSEDETRHSAKEL